MMDLLFRKDGAFDFEDIYIERSDNFVNNTSS